MSDGWVEIAFAEHFRDVYRYVAAHLDHDEVEDAVAEVFAIALRKPEPDQPLHWLIGTARNVVYRGHHRRSRHKRIAELVEPPNHPPVAQHVETSLAITQAMQRLKRADRELLALCLIEGFDRADVAELLGCTTNALNVRLHRAKENFKHHYTELTREEQQ